MWWLRETGDAVDVVTVYPEDGEFRRIAQELLAVAEHPRDVQVVSHPRMGFKVPSELFDKFHVNGQQTWEAEDVKATEAAPEQEQPKRRGRPRKNPQPEQEVEEL